MFSTSLKNIVQCYDYPLSWFPRPFVWRNFVDGWQIGNFSLYLKNTLVVTFGAMAGAVLSCSLVAYGFARFKVPGKDILFLLLLGTMMVPFHVTMVPLFILFKQLGWINTFKPLIIPSFFAISPFFVFLLRQFFRTIPTEIEDAAIIDGCSYFDVFWRIILPLAKPALAAVVIFSFTWNWNDFLGPLIYLGKGKYTLQVGLANFIGQLIVIKWNYMMAVSILVMLPCVILFFFTQRYFIQGVVFTGIKE